MLFKSKYIFNKTDIPYLRGGMDIITVIFYLRLYKSFEKKLKKIAVIIIFNSIISFIYHKIKLSPSSEQIISLLDNYCIALRTCINGNVIMTNGKNERYIALFLSTTLLFVDQKHYKSRNYCILPFFFTLPYIENIYELQLICMYILSFLFYCLEYHSFTVFSIDFGKPLRNNKWVSNHEIFHILLFITERNMIKKYEYLNSEKGLMLS